MKFPIFSLLGLAMGVHAANFPFPENSTIVPVKYSGSGCPLVSTDRRTSVVDYMFGTYDTDKGIWNYALNLPPTMGPALWSDIDESYRLCSHEWKFVNSDGYRLVVDSNGTEINARYRMKEGMTVTWKVTYSHPDGSENVDTISVKGPLGGPYSSSAFAPATDRTLSAPPEKAFKTGCAQEDHVVKMKTEAKIEGKDTWGQVWGANDGDFYNRIMQKFSYSWEKCE